MVHLLDLYPPKRRSSEYDIKESDSRPKQTSYIYTLGEKIVYRQGIVYSITKLNNPRLKLVIKFFLHLWRFKMPVNLNKFI